MKSPVEIFEKITGSREKFDIEDNSPIDDIISANYDDYEKLLSNEKFKKFVEVFGINYNEYINIVKNYYKKLSTRYEYKKMGYDDIIYTIFVALGFVTFKTGRGTIVITEGEDAQEIVLYIFGDPDSGIVSYNVARIKGYRFGTSFIIHDDMVVYGSVYPTYPRDVAPVWKYAIDVLRSKLMMEYYFNKAKNNEDKENSAKISKYVEILDEIEKTLSGESDEDQNK